MKQEKNTILIVEDQELNRDILKFTIEDEYGYLEAENGQQAFDILEEHSEDIVAILLDIIMPVMDGFEFLEKLKETAWDSIPIIAMTGDSSTATEEKALDLGAWDYVTKPYKEKILLTRIKNAIARSKMS